jgi:nucleoside-diphosphate-sugar epimerase
MAEHANHAIVYGASGLIGWAIVNQLLDSYPNAGAFSKVTAVTNRPLNLSETYWPIPNSKRPDLELVSGIDIGQEDETAVADTLKLTVRDIDTVTHVFYLGMHLPLVRTKCRRLII